MNRTEPLADLAGRVKAFIRCTADGVALCEDEFTALALLLFQAQFEQVEPYRRFCLQRGVGPEATTRWQSVPAVPAEGFKEFELTALAPEERVRVFHSSATSTHRPSRHFHGPGSLELYEVSLGAWFERHLLPDAAGETGMRFLALTPDSTAAPHSSLVHMFEAVIPKSAAGPDRRCFAARVNPDGGWRLEAKQALGFLRNAVDAGDPVCLLGPAFSHVHLLEALEAGGDALRLPMGSRLMETGGYKGRSREVSRRELHAWITRRLGIAPEWIVGEYGMSELGSQAYNHVAGQALRDGPPVFRFPPWGRARVISPDTGDEVAPGATGLVQVFDLANVWSVMAVETGDLARRFDDGFELLGRAPATGPRGCSLMPSDLVGKGEGP
ncbi:MAG: hypothetical protein KDM81_12755 [Verrucomicrobiae bacterium]|nr:hypothetical protein [Verrucomicrobiae bacterium]